MLAGCPGVYLHRDSLHHKARRSLQLCFALWASLLSPLIECLFLLALTRSHSLWLSGLLSLSLSLSRSLSLSLSISLSVSLSLHMRIN